MAQYFKTVASQCLGTADVLVSKNAYLPFLTFLMLRQFKECDCIIELPKLQKKGRSREENEIEGHRTVESKAKIVFMWHTKFTPIGLST